MYQPQRPHEVPAFGVLDGRHLGPRRLLAVVAPGAPDGLAVDRQGRLYVATGRGVQAFSPPGDLVGEIALPGAVGLAFGGPDGTALFITTDTAVWAALLRSGGLER